jgi:hypothetical protein
MNTAQYLAHLKHLAHDSGSDAWTSENVFALFQQFRPDGQGLQSIFSPIPSGEDYVKRLLPAYQVTAGPECSDDAYFVVRSPLLPCSGELEDLGRQFLANLKELSSLLSDSEVSDFLSGVSEVRCAPVTDDILKSDDHLTVYEPIGDWLGDHTSHEDLLPVLGEAYYSIACDSWLQYYFEWPYYSHLCTTDVFRPYFDMWIRGCICAFTRDGLTIGERA